MQDINLERAIYVLKEAPLCKLVTAPGKLFQKYRLSNGWEMITIARVSGSEFNDLFYAPHAFVDPAGVYILNTLRETPVVEKMKEAG